jgi:hypothetical protein
VLKKIEKKYGIKLPRKVITIDYGDDVGDLFIRFKHAETTHGEPTCARASKFLNSSAYIHLNCLRK